MSSPSEAPVPEARLELSLSWNGESLPPGTTEVLLELLNAQKSDVSWKKSGPISGARGQSTLKLTSSLSLPDMDKLLSVLSSIAHTVPASSAPSSSPPPASKQSTTKPLTGYQQG